MKPVQRVMHHRREVLRKLIESARGEAGVGQTEGTLPRRWVQSFLTVIMALLHKPLVDGIRAIAVFEAAKGAVVLLAGFGLLGLLHRDLQAVAERMVRFSHLNPASKFPRIFVDAATQVTDAQLWCLAAAAAAYAVVRGFEAYGLWMGRAWAEWLALVAGALYLPVEYYHLWHRFTWFKLGIVGVNLGVVAVMVYALRHRAEQERELADRSAAV